MAEKEQRKVKKGLVITLAILILIAIVVVLIIVLLPKDTNKAINKAQTQEASMFLQDSDERMMFSSFQTKISNADLSTFVIEAKSAENISNTLKNIMHFYNKYLIFTNSNGTFQNNYNVIMDGFKDANAYQKQLNKIIKDVYERVSPTQTFTYGAWTDFKEVYVKYVKAYSKSINGLNKVLISCLPSGVINNDLTKVVLNTIDDFLIVINKGFDKNQYVVNYATTFVNYYLNTSNSLAQYKFSSTLQDKVSKLNTFIDKCPLIDVIEKINKQGIEFSATDEISLEIVNVMKSFLQGGF